jgi:hypothetical protein
MLGPYSTKDNTTAHKLTYSYTIRSLLRRDDKQRGLLRAERLIRESIRSLQDDKQRGIHMAKRLPLGKHAVNQGKLRMGLECAQNRFKGSFRSDYTYKLKDKDKAL